MQLLLLPCRGLFFIGYALFQGGAGAACAPGALLSGATGSLRRATMLLPSPPESSSRNADWDAHIMQTGVQIVF